MLKHVRSCQREHDSRIDHAHDDHLAADHLVLVEDELDAFIARRASAAAAATRQVLAQETQS